MEPCASIELITGPMFSGKTTEILRILSMYTTAKFKALYVNSDIDERSECEFSTHNKMIKIDFDIDMLKTKTLTDIEYVCIKYDVIAIDEAQFFTGLYDFCTRLCDTYKKKVIVAGLNGTSDRKLFGDISLLLPVCDNVTFLTAICSYCANDRCIEKAIFSKRTVENSEVIRVGGIESYVPVCRKHY